MEIPITILLGIISFALLVITSVFGMLIMKGKPVLKYHKWLAYLTMAVAAAHALIIISRYY